jgi:molybdopterin-guanine dinucleotide biosynthesis protein A
LRRVLDELAPLADEIVLLTNEDLTEVYRGLGTFRLVFDAESYSGPLNALADGLENSLGDVCLAVACDMPFASREVFERLLALRAETGANAALARVDSQLQPLHGVYLREPALAVARGALAGGTRSMIGGVLRMEPAILEVADDRPFFNVNTPEELEAAQALASETR